MTSLTVAKGIKEFGKTNNICIGADVYEALEKKVNTMLAIAATRATDNKRKTIKAYDL